MTTDDPIIRPARSGEAELLSNLALRVRTMRGQARGCIEDVKDGECPTDSQLLSKYMRIFVLEQGGGLIGFYLLKLQSKLEIELSALFVEPAYFGKGYWQLLLEHAKSAAVKLGAERLLVSEGDPNVVGQYMAAGAAFTGLLESATTPGQTLASFKLDLPSAHVA
jgi:GNAT superfamily N-acetyltransferase